MSDFQLFFSEEHAVREEDLSDEKIREHLIDLVEIAVEQRFAAGYQYAQTLHRLEFAQDLFHLFRRQFILAGITDITVFASEVAGIGDLEFKVTK